MGRFNGVLDCFIKTAREEGVGAFYKGEGGSPHALACRYWSLYAASHSGNTVPQSSGQAWWLNAEQWPDTRVECTGRCSAGLTCCPRPPGFIPNFGRLGSWNVACFLVLEQVGAPSPAPVSVALLPGCAAEQHDGNQDPTLTRLPFAAQVKKLVTPKDH